MDTNLLKLPLKRTAYHCVNIILLIDTVVIAALIDNYSNIT